MQSFINKLKRKTQEERAQVIYSLRGQLQKNPKHARKAKTHLKLAHLEEFYPEWMPEDQDKDEREEKEKGCEEQVSKSGNFHLKVAWKFISLYKSAERRGKEFSLSLRDVAHLVVQTKCYYTGTPFTDEEGPYKATVDRIDRTKGYVRGNVVMCCELANRVKNELFEREESHIKTEVEFVAKLIEKL